MNRGQLILFCIDCLSFVLKILLLAFSSSFSGSAPERISWRKVSFQPKFLALYPDPDLLDKANLTIWTLHHLTKRIDRFLSNIFSVICLSSDSDLKVRK